MAKKKSYNPFKMWGSYVGGIISLIYFFFSTKYNLFDARDIILKLGFGLDTQTQGFITGTILMLIIGFIIGWLIHSIFRYFWRRR